MTSRKTIAKATITIFLAILCVSLTEPVDAKQAAGKPNNNQLVYGLSNQQALSRALGAWGVPAAVLIQGKRQRGFYVTGLTGQGLANDLGLSAGDTLMTLNGKGLDSAAAADAILTATKAGNLRGSVAKVRGSRVVLTSPFVSFAGYSPAPTVAAAKPGPIMIRGSQFKDPQDDADAAQDGSAPKAPPDINSLEEHMVSLINQDRQANGGLPPVRRSSQLSAVARAYAEDMAKRNFFDHVDPEGRQPHDRVQAAGINCRVWENIAWQKNFKGFTKLVEQCQFNMMNEPPNQPNHRGNILNGGHQVVGVGVAVVMPNTLICVQEFSPQAVP